MSVGKLSFKKAENETDGKIEETYKRLNRDEEIKKERKERKKERKKIAPCFRLSSCRCSHYGVTKPTGL